MIGAAFLNLKPGTTKTTSAVYLASALHAHGLRVLLVDADPQGSAQRWADLAEGFPWDTVGMARRTAGRDLRRMIDRNEYEAVIADTPQLEDHAVITRAVMTVLPTWIVPVAPSPIEIHRTMDVIAAMDEVEASADAGDIDRMALLTRCNRRWASKSGPDAEARAELEKLGLRVLVDQVQHHDGLYRQTYGSVPEAEGTAYETLADDLLEQLDGARVTRASVSH